MMEEGKSIILVHHTRLDNSKSLFPTPNVLKYMFTLEAAKS